MTCRPACLPALLLALATTACDAQTAERRHFDEEAADGPRETATLGGGCFWCLEAVFHRLDGVTRVVSGYAGGSVEDPSYEDVCSGRTGHAEVCQVTWDPRKLSYEEVLEVFFETHDPTTLNRQGHDVGSQYRSILLYHGEEQKATAERIVKDLGSSGAWDDPIVTEIAPFATFYPAEGYHQDYFEKNPDKPYCAYVVGPKVEKFEKVFADKLKGRKTD